MIHFNLLNNFLETMTFLNVVLQQCYNSYNYNERVQLVMCV